MTPQPGLLSAQLERAVRMAQQVRAGDFQARVHAHWAREATGITITAEHAVPTVSGAARSPRLALLGPKQLDPQILAVVLQQVAVAGPPTRALAAATGPAAHATSHARRLHERLAALAEIDRKVADLAQAPQAVPVPLNPTSTRSGR